MFKLICLGTMSGVFFCFTFLLNEVMSVNGGHWVWSAALRYSFMVVLLTGLIFLQGGSDRLKALLALFIDNWKLWVTAGSIGFGLFYGLICFAADYSPAWVVAATWQFTVVASLMVLMAFGRSFPPVIWLFALIIFSGVTLVNLTHIEGADMKTIIQGALPVMAAAFCYPFGNQLVWEAEHGNHPKIPRIHSPLLKNVFNKVFLMTLGSLPLWVLVVVVILPPAPSGHQVMSTALVALVSGICATGIFLFARNLASSSKELAAVEASQSCEVIFALVGGLIFMDTQMPRTESWLGLAMIILGLSLFLTFNKGPAE